MISYALKVIENCSRDMLSTNTAFRGKAFLLGKHFRKVLPVVPRAPPLAIPDVCLKHSNM